jgi:hypothetical protein
VTLLLRFPAMLLLLLLGFPATTTLQAAALWCCGQRAEDSEASELGTGTIVSNRLQTVD